MKKYFILYVLALFTFSCSEQEIETYSATEPDGISGIYFQFMESYIPNSQGQIIESRFVDSISRNFVNYPANKELVVGLPVYMMGYPTSYDRKVDFKVNEEMTNCTEGEEFTLDYDNVFVRAGSVRATIPLTIKRTPLTQTMACRVVVELVENEYFKLLIDQYNDNTIASNAKKKYDAKLFKVIFSNIITENNIGSYFLSTYFGDWTIEKFNVINSQTGWTLRNWQDAGSSTFPSPVSLNTLPYAAYVTQRYLQEEADRGVPVKEIDGTFMQLGPSYEVDYSAYEL